MKRIQQDSAISSRHITRRGLVVGGVQVAFASVLGWRMYSMQIQQSDQFRMLAEENRINVRLLSPARGLIFDRNGRQLAANDPNYRIVIVREDAGDVARILEKLKEIVQISDEDITRTINETERLSAFVPVTVADRLTWDELSRVAVNGPALPGVHPEVGLSRSYPLKDDFAHVVGYVGPVSDYDLAQLDDQDPLLQIPKFQIGKTGVESKMEQTLRGKAGNSQIEVNAVGRVMRELSRTEGTPGSNLQLTVDSGLQNYVQARLGGESASAVVTDVTNGDLVAIGSSPSFDPNLFVRGISSADYRTLTSNVYRPLANKSVQGMYPPGSTFKMITALAALEAGVVSLGETVYCPGFLKSGNRRFHCWRGGGHGHMNLHESLKQSCDVYYYDVAQRVGIDRISEMAKKLGVGIRYDLPMSAVAEGIAPNHAWKQESRSASWVIGDTLNASIGQGFVLATPLQLSVMTSRLASGRMLSPRLVKSIDGVEQQVVDEGPLDVHPMHLAAVRKGMFAVCNERRGTGYSLRVIEDTMKIAGKSGTSQVRNITAAERARGVFRNEDLPWNRRDHALFVAYAPYDAPRYAVSVIVEHGGGGSSVAGPIARDILLRAMYGEVPPLDAYPESQREKAREVHEAMDLRPTDQPDTAPRSRA
ncbi:penicillin-binding protein 2 [Qingshengfaniella alkalisoli]|uniref:Penicillin-binding protein 2 n=1 Tax=Qingshengfaniella alkalisoli TaxID=2599296 RepID=A0A5B8IVV8_9RHOB|nr:penicillin-binding protein 2 [Qingshengfaniella alkalisoli]QDY69613.1 penicillin-binding protein 2 [Qingshengfaniella alkalisoli]